MNLAISNIAWPAARLDDALDIMAENSARGLEFAPGLLFPDEKDAFAPSDAAVARLEGKLSARGIRLVSIQSLLYGAVGAQLFGTTQERIAFTRGMSRAIGLADQLMVPNIVFGSPANRSIPANAHRDSAHSDAVAIFRDLGDQAAGVGTRIALEPNPAAYGTNFLNSVEETFAFCEVVAHPAITVNFDLGALHMNGTIDIAGRLFHSHYQMVSHVHVSEAQLAPAPADAGQFARIAADIYTHGYTGWFSIEMRAVSENPLAAVAEKLATAAIALSTKFRA